MTPLSAGRNIRLLRPIRRCWRLQTADSHSKFDSLENPFQSLYPPSSLRVKLCGRTANQNQEPYET